ncbi:MAG TPA: hypothetical protein DEQ02_05980, partial [Ruminococcaceae bacterium]|nr:hypothetical protein [Oscillospiraceae bacterium]
MRKLSKSALSFTIHAFVMFVFVTFSLCFLFIGEAFAAPLSDIPMSLTQPDGSTLECFASGDEYFNYLHDADGNLIMQNPETGYYVYASIYPGGKLTASIKIAMDDGYFYNRPSRTGSISRISSNGIGLEDVDFSVNSDLVSQPEEPSKPDSAQPENTDPQNIGITRANPVEGLHENIVVMICFADEDPVIEPAYADRVMGYFNGSGVSLKSYMKTVSEGLFEINSTLVGMDGDTVLMYQDINPRGYYQPYNAQTNPIGYAQGADPTDSGLKAGREYPLIRRAIEAINGSSLLAGKNLDADGDGVIDSITFVVSGEPTAWSTILWPHRWSGITGGTVYLNSKRISGYTFQMQSRIDVNIICHETLHDYSYPDFYRYSPAGGYPVQYWDIMSHDNSLPQFPTSHSRLRYSGWGDPLVEITENGRYTLSPTGSKDGITAYAVPTNDPNQFIMLEYRSDGNESAYDKYFRSGSYYGRGLTIARVNTARSGNEHRDWTMGTPYRDELYFYRPDETGYNLGNGNISYASLSVEAARTSFGNVTGTGYDGRIYLEDGSNTTYVVSNVSTAGETISFDLRIEDPVANTVTYVVGSEGTVSATLNGNSFTSGTAVPSGSAVVFTTVPNENYLVDEWIVNGAVQSATGNSFTLSNITASSTVTVT